MHSSLISVENALAQISASAHPVMDFETLGLRAAANRVLAQDVIAAFPSPAWNNCAMDGFAIAFKSGERFRIIGRASAAQPFPRVVEAGEAIEVSTGTVLPHGCDTVVAREYCEVDGGVLTVKDWPSRGTNVRLLGENYQAGMLLLASGTRLGPSQVGLAASAGFGQVQVYRRLRVAVGATGTELRDTSGKLAAGQIFNSNLPMILGFAGLLGVELLDLGIVPDESSALMAALERSALCDAIVLTGGTSKGREDLLQDSIERVGGEVLGAGISMKPGRPTIFGTINRALLLGLPGNPVAAAIAFLILGVPALRRLAGENPRRPMWIGVRADFAWRRKSSVQEYLQVVLKAGPDGLAVVDQPLIAGSAMLRNLVQSDGLLRLDKDILQVEPGSIVPYCSYFQLVSS